MAETRLEKETRILKEFIDKSVVSLDKGDSVLVSGGYIQHDDTARILDKHCSKIVNKLTSLGYEYTINHGFGCKDYRFMKKIEL